MNELNEIINTNELIKWLNKYERMKYDWMKILIVADTNEQRCWYEWCSLKEVAVSQITYERR